MVKKTMSRCFAELIEATRSAGVLVVPQSLPVSRVVEDLLLIASATEPEEWVDRIAYLPL